MAAVVGVHGIGQRCGTTVRAEWLAALREGLRGVGARLADADLDIAFYGDLFQRPGAKVGAGPPLDATDVEAGWESELLEAWWREAAKTDRRVPRPDETTKVRMPHLVQRALFALGQCGFFARLAESDLVLDLKQVSRYFHDPELRARIRERLVEAVRPDTRVLVAHSLGSVVGYETLCAHEEWHLTSLVTLGSPLGIPQLIFDRLQPHPEDGIGRWPGSVGRWFNIADKGDVVALVKELGPLFGERVEDLRVDNGATAHDVMSYLSAAQTGEAVVAGLKR